MTPKALSESAKALRCGLDGTLWKDAQSADKCHELLQMPRGGGRVDDHLTLIPPFNLARAHDLYRALLAPFRDIIKDKSLLIVGSRWLSGLPFNALVTEPPKTATVSRLDQYRDVRWLGTQHPITVLPSLSALRVLRQRAKTNLASRTYLGIGNPLLTGQQDHPRWELHYTKQAQVSWDKQECPEAVVGQPVDASRAVINPIGSDSKGDEIRTRDPLSDTADLLCEVGRRLDASKNDILLGPQASKRVLEALSQAGRLAQYRILYFSTHCALTDQVKGVTEPALVLTPQQADVTDPWKLDRDDGLLTTHEIKALKLDADWVALSSCRAAAGNRENADSLSDLAVAFFHAGAQALLISYWEVGFDATVKLTTGAFAELNANPTIGQAAAMRNSMRSLIMHGSPLEAHPSQWAPFVVVGAAATVN